MRRLGQCLVLASLTAALVLGAGHAGMWPGPVTLDEAAAAQRQPTSRVREKRNSQKPKSEETRPAELAPAAGGETATPSTAPASPVETTFQKAETIEADVSTRSVAIKLGFTGTEIIVFGTVDNSRQPSAESGYYDVVVALEGQASPVVVRRKSNVAGLWMNTSAFAFDRVPSYYAISSTRPLEEIAEPPALAEHAIGFEHIKIRPKEGRVRSYSDEELKGYRDAIVRLKEDDELYLKSDYGVTFVGRSLFRSTISLPANIAVGPVEARVYLFREGKLMSKISSRVTLERAGVELWLHGFANGFPLLYGLFTVAVAVSAGLLASAVFTRGAH